MAGRGDRTGCDGQGFQSAQQSDGDGFAGSQEKIGIEHIEDVMDGAAVEGQEDVALGEACFLGAGPRCDELDARGGRADGDTELELPGFGPADGGEVGGEFGDGGGGG